MPEYVGPHSVSGNLLLFPRGSSANFISIMWSLFVGVISYGFLAIFRDILIVPVFDKPVDTARDVVKYGLLPFVLDGGNYQRTHLLNSPSADYQYIGSILMSQQPGKSLKECSRKRSFKTAPMYMSEK